MTEYAFMVEKLRPYRIAVLCGGPGAEREVSLNSGENAHQALIRAGLVAEKVIVPETDPESCLRALDCQVAVLMLHGEFGEDGTAQRILTERGIAFTGSEAEVCALAMDKNACKELMRKANIPTARWAVCGNAADAENAVAAAQLSYPLFVKPNSRGSSVGVTRVGTPAELAAAVEKALAEDTLALIEELVQGPELTVGWLDGKVFPVIQLSADGVFYDYHAKYISNETRYLCPAPLDAETTALVKRYAAETAALIGMRDVARVDLMLGRAGPMVLEINTLPGYTTHSLLPMAAAAARMSIEELSVRLAALAAARYKETSGNRGF